MEEFDDSPLGLMSRIRKTFKSKARRLVRKLQHDPVEVLEVNEKAFQELQGDLRDFYIQRDIWESGLPHTQDDQQDYGLREDQEGDAETERDRGEPIFPAQGPGAGFHPEKLKVLMEDFRHELDRVIEEFVKFKMRQDHFWQLNIARITSLSFLQANNEELEIRNRISAEEAALQSLIDNAQNLVDRDNVLNDNGERLSNISNLESNRVASIIEDGSIFNGRENEVPEIINQERVELSHGDQERPISDQARQGSHNSLPQRHGDAINPKDQSSKKGSGSSTSIQSIAGIRFQKQRRKLNKAVTDLEDNPDIHTDFLNDKVKRIVKDFKAINIDNILEKFLYDPNMDDIYDGTANDISDWYDDLEDRIELLQDRAEGQIAERKSAVTSGFEKRAFPRFDGDRMEYYSFKKRWLKEVGVERQHPQRELSSLTASLCKAAQNKIIDCETLKEVWTVLDREYGDLKELRAALKLKISQLKLKTHAGPGKVLELFQQVQYLTVKVKAHGGENALKHDEEYIALLLRHLTDEQQDKWVDSECGSWDSFYNFLEKLAIQARKKVGIQDTLKAMGARGSDDKSTTDKKYCTTCGKTHGGSCRKDRVVATTTEVKKPGGKQAYSGPKERVRSNKSYTCPVCKQPQHQWTTNSGEKRHDKALTSCPKWQRSNSADKVKILEEIQAIPLSVCKNCSRIGHISSNCFKKDKNVCENNNCGQNHIKEMCNFQPYIVGCLRIMSVPLLIRGETDVQEAKADAVDHDSSENDIAQEESNAVRFGDKSTASLLSVVTKATEAWVKEPENLEAMPKEEEKDSNKMLVECHKVDISAEEEVKSNDIKQTALELKEESSNVCPFVSNAMSMISNTMANLASGHSVLSEMLSSKKTGYNWNYKEDNKFLSVSKNFSKIEKDSKAHTDEGFAELKCVKLQSHNESLLTFCDNVPINYISSTIFKTDSQVKAIDTVKFSIERDLPLSSIVTNVTSPTIVDTSNHGCIYAKINTGHSNNMKLSKVDDIFKVTEKVRDVIQSWMLCKSMKSKAYINREYNAQCSWLTINTMQFKLLNQLAIHTVSALEIGMIMAIRYLIELAIKIVFPMGYKRHYDPGIIYIDSSIAENTFSCIKKESNYNKELLMFKSFCDMHLSKGTYSNHSYIWCKCPSRNNISHIEKGGPNWLIQERKSDKTSAIRILYSKDNKENNYTFSIFASVVDPTSANTDIKQLVDVESTAVVRESTSIKEDIIRKTLNLTKLVFPSSPLQAVNQLPRDICDMISSHLIKDSVALSPSALGIDSAPVNAEVMQLIDVDSTSIVEMSPNIIKILSKELLLSAPLNEASNKNLKWPYGTLARQDTQSYCYYYKEKVTGSFIQRKDSPWKIDKQVATYQAAITFDLATKLKELNAQVIKTFKRDFLYDNRNLTLTVIM